MARRIVLALALAAGLSAGPALAEPPYPTVDFQGDWVLSNTQGMEVKARMFFSAAERKMRIEMDQPNMKMNAVRDLGSGDMIMWSDMMPNVGMRLPSVKDEDFNADKTDETKTIDGEECTIWKMATAEACLTAENIPLQVTGDKFQSGLHNLQRTAQDPALFEVPAGLNIMDMPANMPTGNGMQPGKGLPF